MPFGLGGAPPSAFRSVALLLGTIQRQLTRRRLADPPGGWKANQISLGMREPHHPSFL